MFTPVNSLDFAICLAPRTRAWKAAQDHKAYRLFFDCGPTYAEDLRDLIRYNLKVRDYHFTAREWSASDYDEYFDLRYRGWEPKEAFKIASRYWNDDNHPGIEGW